MAAPFGNIRSKLDRAIVAYLQTAGVCDLIYPGQYGGVIPAADDGTTPLWVVVRSHQGTEEVLLSGVWRFKVECAVHGPANPQPNQVNLAGQRVSFDSIFSAMHDALMTSEDSNQTLQATADAITDAGRALATTGTDQEKQNNADMVDFTCQYWYPPISLDGGSPRTEGTPGSMTLWKELAVFECIANAFNVS